MTGFIRDHLLLRLSLDRFLLLMMNLARSFVPRLAPTIISPKLHLELLKVSVHIAPIMPISLSYNDCLLLNLLLLSRRIDLLLLQF